MWTQRPQAYAHSCTFMFIFDLSATVTGLFAPRTFHPINVSSPWTSRSTDNSPQRRLIPKTICPRDAVNINNQQCPVFSMSVLGWLFRSPIVFNVSACLAAYMNILRRKSEYDVHH